MMVLGRESLTGFCQLACFQPYKGSLSMENFIGNENV